MIFRRQAFFEYVREETFGKFGLQQIQVPRVWPKPCFFAVFWMMLSIENIGIENGSVSSGLYTLLETNISPEKSILKMIFLFPRWDMLIPWRVFCKLIV